MKDLYLHNLKSDPAKEVISWNNLNFDPGVWVISLSDLPQGSL